MHVPVEEFGLGNESFKLSNTVKQASSDLARHFAVNVVDGEVNRVSDELQLLATVGHGMELLNVDLGEANLLDLGSGNGLGLSSESLGVGRHGGSGGWGEASRVHDGLLRMGHLGVLADALGLGSATTGVASSVASTAVVLATSTLLVISLVLIEALLLILLLLHSVAGASEAAHATHLVEALRLVSHLLRVSDPVHHLVLFSGVAFVLELLLRDPEVDGYRSVSKR